MPSAEPGVGMDWAAQGLTVTAIETAVMAQVGDFLPIAIVFGAVGVGLTLVARIRRKLIKA